MTDIEQKAREVAEQWDRENPLALTGVGDLAALIAAALQSAVAEEREGCAKIAEDDDNPHRSIDIADAIRARGQKETA